MSEKVCKTSEDLDAWFNNYQPVYHKGGYISFPGLLIECAPDYENEHDTRNDETVTHPENPTKK